MIPGDHEVFDGRSLKGWHAAREMISQQQNDIIMLELERDALNEEIKKLKQRNDNQASLLVAIEEGKAKKCPDGGWYKP
jgi:hypothetical protein